MKHYLGLNEYHLRQRKNEVPALYDPSCLINGHLLLCGMSGTGKTFQSKRLLAAAAKSGISADVFDVHEELSGLPYSKACKYSQATQLGYNPLELSTDPHVGGVNPQADFIVRLIKQVTRQFGSKQESALRNLIVDTYASRGIFADNQRSWDRKQITEAQRRTLISDRKWRELRDYYPTLTDLLDYAERKVLTMLFGGDNKAMAALEYLCSQNSKLQRLRFKMHKSAIAPDEQEKLEERIAAAQEKAIDAYTQAVEAGPGREPKDLIKYDSKDVLIGVVQRLQILASAGIFEANEPDFGNAKLHVHEIKSLNDDQQVLFVKLRMREIFERCKQQGPTGTGTELRHIIFLDEAPKYFTEDKDDIINVIAREARKFGLGLWCAAQEPTSFPQSFVTNCGAKILLGIDSSFWKGVISKMRITEDGLRYIKAKEVMAIKLHRDGQPDPPFVNVVVPNPANGPGRAAQDWLDHQQGQAAA